MTNDQLLQKIYDKVSLMEEQSENLDRTVALFNVKMKLIDIAIEDNLKLKCSKKN